MSAPGDQVPRSPAEKPLYSIASHPPDQQTSPAETYEFVSQEPLEVFILKVHSRCNLACDYCYMYTAADQSWRQQPKIMSADTVVATAKAISQHAQARALPKVLAVIHGGEPLLAEKAQPGFLRFLARTLRSTIETDQTKLQLGMQTNGTLLTPEILDICREERIQVGVSLDGPPGVNDRRRLYANGEGSHDDAVRGLRLLQQYPDIYGSLLCVIDPSSNPVEVYEYLASFNPPKIEFLLEHANWNSLPLGYKSHREARHPDFTPYADWLGAIASIWMHKPKPGIPLFEERLRLGMGLPTRLEYLGDNAVRNVITVETDGSMEAVDTYKVTEDGGTKLGLHVSKNTFDEAIQHPKIRAQRLGRAGLAAQCLSCDVLLECGGGYPPHRYSEENEFANPSVYCTDLQAFIRKTGIQFGHHIGGSREYAGIQHLIGNLGHEVVNELLHHDGTPHNSFTYHDFKPTYS